MLMQPGIRPVAKSTHHVAAGANHDWNGSPIPASVATRRCADLHRVLGGGVSYALPLIAQGLVCMPGKIE